MGEGKSDKLLVAVFAGVVALQGIHVSVQKNSQNREAYYVAVSKPS